MKFLVTNELRLNPLLRLLVAFFVVMMMLFILSDIALFHYQIGLTPQKATLSLLGDEEAFIEPMLFDVLLERVHVTLFISMITLATLVSIYIRVVKPTTYRIVHTVFLSAVGTPVLLLFGYFVVQIFIALSIGLFLLWHGCALYMCVVILKRL